MTGTGPFNALAGWFARPMPIHRGEGGDASLAQRIRQAALGPRPHMLTYHVMSWLRDEWFLPDYLLDDFVQMRTDSERRMFLLFAAEDLDTRKRCEPCRQTGLIHCSDPSNCGGPWDEHHA